MKVAPYDPEKVRIVKSSNWAPVALEPLLDPEAREMAAHPERYILEERAPSRAADFIFYSDPALRIQDTLLQLKHRLIEKGLIVFRLDKACTIGVFFVSKKDGSLRLIFDCRGANMLCVPPRRHRREAQRDECDKTAHGA